MSSIIKHLFETKALRVAKEDQPFWYTSGLFGPYYVNTHFLIGSEELAKALLEAIDAAANTSDKSSREAFPSHVLNYTDKAYNEAGLYKEVIDASVNAIKDLDFDFISGGERRDFFFSMQVARVLNVPHLSIFKNGDIVWSNKDFAEQHLIIGEELSPSAKDILSSLEGKKALHIADLVTQASSYTRAWLPAIKQLGAKITDTLAIVDRDQGGLNVLKEEGVALHSLAAMTDDLFVKAKIDGLIKEEQLALVRSYAKGPETFIRDFIKEHPSFLETEQAKDEKTKERVERLLSLDIL